MGTQDDIQSEGRGVLFRHTYSSGEKSTSWQAAYIPAYGEFSPRKRKSGGRKKKERECRGKESLSEEDYPLMPVGGKRKYSTSFFKKGVDFLLQGEGLSLGRGGKGKTGDGGPGFFIGKKGRRPDLRGCGKRNPARPKGPPLRKKGGKEKRRGRGSRVIYF